ncbi:MAG: DUF5060 domain-containing protein [Saprospiraceae bacterium]
MRRLANLCFLFLITVSCFIACQSTTKESAILTAKKWDKVTLTFKSIPTSETAEDNPFLNYRLNVTFRNGQKTMMVPGFYAADGNAGETSAETGNVWKVHFRPDMEGTWEYAVSFRKGIDIAIATDANAGVATDFDGQTGTIQVSAAEAGTKGRLQYVGKRYLQYAESGNYFLKGGADSPENFLGYFDFDGTARGGLSEEREGEASAKDGLHKFEPHLKDWKTGDPTWQGDKGKGMIGALNYLASKGMNSVYFLTMNIEGDGKDVFPYTSYEERFRFDCSKLAQWEIVFDQMDKLGLMQHIVLQETENETLLDKGDTGKERKLYLREMIARFAHHPQVKWNIGEENGPAHWSPIAQNTAQQKAMVSYLKQTDPYQNFVVIHSHSDFHNRDSLFDLLLGFEDLDGMSMQVNRKEYIHEVTKDWLQKSAAAGKQWVMPMDEIGPHWRGADPDDRVDNNQDTVRALALWGNLMAGGAGAEWYFGYRNHNNDLGCEDWRSRDRLWDYTRHALTFFQTHLPFAEMASQDELLNGDQAYCFAKKGAIYAVYLTFGGHAALDLSSETGTFSVDWYNPRTGGALQKSVIQQLEGGDVVNLGAPPADLDKDWVVLLRKK